MTFYITKYWQTRGIIKRDDLHVYDGEYASGGSIFVRIGKDAFETAEEAQARVLVLAEKKLKTLDKQREAVSKILQNGARVREAK